MNLEKIKRPNFRIYPNFLKIFNLCSRLLFFLLALFILSQGDGGNRREGKGRKVEGRWRKSRIGKEEERRKVERRDEKGRKMKRKKV